MTLDDFVHFRNDSDFDGDLFTNPDNAMNLVPRSMSDRDDYMIDSARAHQVRQVPSVSQNLVALYDNPSYLCPIIVNESFDLEIKISAGFNFFRGEKAGPSGSNQKYRALLVAVAVAVAFL